GDCSRRLRRGDQAPGAGRRRRLHDRLARRRRPPPPTGKAAIVDLAGPAAERRLMGYGPDAGLREERRRAAASGHDAKHLRWLEAKAEKIIRDHWPKVVALGL